MELVFIHGWGFDAGIWRGLCNHLMPHRCHLVDLGFFGNPTLNIKSLSATSSILIGHSLGFAHGLSKNKNWAGWISINSFPRFVNQGDKSGCSSEIELRGMRKRLQSDAASTLHDFYKFIGTSWPITNLDVIKLSEGIDELRVCDVSDTLSAFKGPGLVLASKNDPLVPAALSEELGNMRRTQLIWHSDGGHVLPLSYPEWCATKMINYLDEHFTSP